MKSPWLLLDCHFLCHRSARVHGELSYEGVKTGVMFGFLRDLKRHQDLFQTRRVAFCFDRKPLLRKAHYPAYKANHVESFTPEEVRARDELNRQIRLLREEHLPALGCKNILSHQGYEADDLIAAVVLGHPEEEFVIISSDRDLLQLLRPGVTFYSPNGKKTITQKSFVADYGIPPAKWPYVKALAGCDGDNVKGVRGIGEKTAAAHFAGKRLGPAKAALVKAFGHAAIHRNLPLVKLPLEGCPVPKLVEDAIDPKAWRTLCKALGFASLIDPFDRRGDTR